MGNSHGVIIPKPLLAEADMNVGDHVDVAVKAGKLVIAPLLRDPRSRWAEEIKAIVAAREDSLVWPEFGNDDDKDIEWR